VFVVTRYRGWTGGDKPPASRPSWCPVDKLAGQLAPDDPATAAVQDLFHPGAHRGCDVPTARAEDVLLRVLASLMSIAWHS
jgi:hypothetical protein